MYNIYDEEKYIDTISQYFLLATLHETHLQVITDILMKSELISDIEKNKYDIIMNNTPEEIYYRLFPNSYYLENYNIIYNDAYWCGTIYMRLFYEFKKPFSYIFLKLPLETLLDMYDVYHEMDVSQIYNEFKRMEKEKTIIESLLEKHKMSIAELSRVSKVPVRTISYYKASDENLYKGSFGNIQRLAIALEEPSNLFLDSTPVINYRY